MAKKKECFGGFNWCEKGCFTCEQNFKCFLENSAVKSCIEGRLWGSILECGACRLKYENRSITEEAASFIKICNNVKAILFEREKFCVVFGAPSHSDPCCLCKRFNECEAYELVLGDLSKLYSEKKEEIASTIREFSYETGGCYGDFKFQTECWNGDCDFAISCRRAANIIPSEDCKFYGMTKGDVEHGIEETPAPCKDCESFKTTCEELIFTKIKEDKIREAKEQVFNNFFSLKNLRKALSGEDENGEEEE